MEDHMLKRILFVDDEPNLLQGIERQFRKQYEIETACGAEAGLSTLAAKGPFAVVVSDLRMPGMDGTQFLSRVRRQYPDTVRVMLTGQADLSSAIAAVNEGNIFQFLSKPCQAPMLTRAIDSAIGQHRLITAERELLEKTLHGSVEVMSEILSLVNPSAFSRAQRACRYVRHIVRQLNIPGQWQFEVAAMLSQIGCVTVPADVLEKAAATELLTDEERRILAAHAKVAHDLLMRIPRLESVAEMVAAQESSVYRGVEMSTGEVAVGAHLLRIALDFDERTSRGASVESAIAEMRSHRGYSPAYLDVLETIDVEIRNSHAIFLKVSELRQGMITNTDIRARNGALLLARGQEITEGAIVRLRSFLATGRLTEPLSVIVRRTPAAADASQPHHTAPVTVQ
jgi:response regulator RpfG family c-di-GMP phosphodiesterase